MKVFYVINSELGWDNVVGIFDNRGAAEKCLLAQGECGALIDWMSIQSTYEYEEE